MTVPISNMFTTWATSPDSQNTAIKMNVTDVASAANAKLFDLQVNGVTKFVIYKTGDVVANSVVGAQNFTASQTPPSGARIGDEWMDTDDGVLYTLIAQTTANTYAWVETGSHGIGAPELRYNLDGGAPGTTFGGTTAIDCGGVT